MLIAAAASAGVSVTMGHERCGSQPELLGGWESASSLVFLCPDAIDRENQSTEMILKHELIHVIQDRVPGPLVPEPLLTMLTRELVPSKVALFVILAEENSQHEFEARVLTRLLSSATVASWLKSTTAPGPVSEVAQANRSLPCERATQGQACGHPEPLLSETGQP